MKFKLSSQFNMKQTILAGILLIGVSAMAQDTTGKKVRITSAFKPTLKEAAKINFNASPPNVDTIRPRLQYNIPNQNLSLAFQPGSLKPLAFQVDTGGRWSNESYIKAGFGNLSTPFVQAGLSVGDGRTAGLNVYAKHVSSQGKIQYQDYSHTSFEGNGFFQTGNNIEWDARFGGQIEKYKRYGFEPKTMTFPDDSLNANYQTWRGRVSFHNISRTDLGLSYAPEVSIDAFSDNRDNTESNTYINVPVQKTLGSTFEVDVAATANLSTYQHTVGSNKNSIANNYFYISPSLLYKTDNIFIQAGVRPAWDKSTTKVFPNLMAEFNSNDKRFAFQLGWTGYIRNSGFQYLTSINPYIWAPDNVQNTLIQERYAGFKGSAGDHFSYSAKIGYNEWDNQPLFTNDTSGKYGGKSFVVIYDPKVKVVNFGAELGYTMGEKFSVISNLNFNQYTAQNNDKAWGLIPLEWKTNARAQILKDLYLNAQLYIFDGPWYLTKGGGRSNLPVAADMSAGLEFKIVKNIKLWAQFNNLFNSTYQRWNQYPVYGFNLLGGVVFSFAQSR